VLPTPLDDTLYARDGVADFIDGGHGFDVAGVDKHASSSATSPTTSWITSRCG